MKGTVRIGKIGYASSEREIEFTDFDRRGGFIAFWNDKQLVAVYSCESFIELIGVKVS